MQQLADNMTAQEFGLHLALELEEPLPAAQYQAMGTMLALLANGPLVPPEGRKTWHAHDFAPALWQDVQAAQAAAPAKPLTVADIMASARAAGMVQ